MPTQNSNNTGNSKTETHSRTRDGWLYKWISPAGKPTEVLHASASKGSLLIHKSGESFTVSCCLPGKFIGRADSMDDAIRLAEDWYENRGKEDGTI